MRLSCIFLPFLRISLLSDFLIFLRVWQITHTLEAIADRVRRDLLSSANPSEQMGECISASFMKEPGRQIMRWQISMTWSSQNDRFSIGHNVCEKSHIIFLEFVALQFRKLLGV